MKNQFISKVFLWLSIGLLITFGLGYGITQNEDVLYFVANHYTIFVIIEIVVCIFFSFRLTKMSNTTAKISYLLYTALSGVTFSSIFLVYKLESILWVFLATAVIFGIFSFVGSKIKVNLIGFGSFLTISLLAMIILGLISMFTGNAALSSTVSLVSVFIFVGFIVYDMNRLIKMNKLNLEEKYAVFGAFELYLDIINIILDLLNLTGRERD